MAHQKNWTMPAQVIRVVDGDTVVLNADLGFRLNLQVKARLYGIDTPEMRAPDRPEGIEAKSYLEDLIEEWRIDNQGDETGHPWLIIEIHKNKSDSFWRWTVRLIGKGNMDLNRRLVTAGHARPADFGSDKSPYHEVNTPKPPGW